MQEERHLNPVGRRCNDVAPEIGSDLLIFVEFAMGSGVLFKFLIAAFKSAIKGPISWRRSEKGRDKETCGGESMDRAAFEAEPPPTMQSRITSPESGWAYWMMMCRPSRS